MLFNLFIGVILEEFAKNREENETHLLLDCVYAWRDEWKKYDPDATGRISAEDFIKVIQNSPHPAGTKEMPRSPASSPRPEPVAVMEYGGGNIDVAEDHSSALVGSSSSSVQKSDQGLSEDAIGEEKEKLVSTASYLYDLHLLTSADSAPQDTTTRVYNFCSRMFGSNTRAQPEQNDVEKSTEERVQNNTGIQRVESNRIDFDEAPVFQVDYHSAVIAVAAKVLQHHRVLNTEICLQPEEGEMYIVEWFCKVLQQRPDLLRWIRKFKEEQRPKGPSANRPIE